MDYARFYKYATQEQIDQFHEYRNKAAMAKRILSEPLIYRPDPDVCGFIFAGSYQLGELVTYETQLFRAGQYNSMRGIVNGEKKHKPLGWYGWGNDMAANMPSKILEYG
jgi:hypothetical protein